MKKHFQYYTVFYLDRLIIYVRLHYYTWICLLSWLMKIHSVFGQITLVQCSHIAHIRIMCRLLIIGFGTTIKNKIKSLICIMCLNFRSYFLVVIASVESLMSVQNQFIRNNWPLCILAIMHISHHASWPLCLSAT